MTHSDSAEALVVIDPADRATVMAFARDHGVDIEDVSTRALEPVATVSLLLMGSALAIGGLIDFIDRLKGGQIVDLRPDAARMVYRTKDLAYGLVLIIAWDGRVMVEVREPGGMFGHVVETIGSVLAEATGQRAGVIETVVKDALGDDATVKNDTAG